MNSEIQNPLVNKPGYGFAKRFGVLAGEVKNDTLEVFCRPGTELNAILEMQRLSGFRVIPKKVDEAEFDRLLQLNYQQNQGAASQLMDGLDEEEDESLDGIAQALFENQDLLESEDDAPIIKFINGLLIEAIKENASDVHIETFESSLNIRFRVDGVLREVMSPPRSLAPRITSRIKIMSKLDIAEKRLPQDGRISRSIAGRKVDVRVSTIPTGQNSERVVLRILDKQAGSIDLVHLGLDPRQTATLTRVIEKPYGILLVTGPTGSGKSTTLYAALQVLNDRSRNIMTVEDPIEYNIEGIGQTQVNAKVNMTFARGLRAILRQDPDVVMVGEIRDLETAQIAVQASLTGHMVMSTLHTNTAIGAITRLRDMGVEPFLLSTSLVGLMAQRLVRVLCANCKEGYEADKFELETLGISTTEPKQLFRAKGCPQCRHTGFAGRTGIHEIIEVDHELETMIHDNASEQVMETYARSKSPGIMQSGREKVLSGVTTLREILRVTTED